MKIGITVVLVLILLMSLFVLKRARRDVIAKFTPCPKEIEFQVLNQLRKTLHGYNTVNAWIDKPSLADLDKEQTEINRIRQWLKTADCDACTKSQYNEWLDYYFQHGLDDAYKEVKTHAEAKHMEEYNREADDLFRRVREREKTNPVCAPPQPDCK